MLADLRDTPLAVGMYALVARLYFLHKDAVPLSSDDVMRYDPTLRRGAVIRAIARLESGNWLLCVPGSQRKKRYLPTWGLISGEVRPWELNAPGLGRPAHVQRQRLDRRLLDLYLGRLEPHPSHPARVERYTSAPLLSLRDVGSYALTLDGLPTTTAALNAWGLCQENRAMPLPDETTLLALISQRTLLEEDGVLLAPKGYARLGISTVAAPCDEAGVPLIFVPSELIGASSASLIGASSAPLIGDVIGEAPTAHAGFSALPKDTPTSASAPAPAEGNESLQAQKRNPKDLPPPQGQEAQTATEQFLQQEGIAPTVAHQFRHVNLAAACAHLHTLIAQGCGPGAVVVRWRASPPSADHADEQAVALAPPDFTPTMVATLASFLRDGYSPEAACHATRHWITQPTEQRGVSTGQRRTWRADAPRRSGGSHGHSAMPAAHGRAATQAPADFSPAMLATLATYLADEVELDEAIMLTRAWHGG
jgi:hypothetical protein